MKLGVRTLRAFESRTAGAISIGPLRSDALALVLAGGGSIRLDRLDNARSLDVRITGAGEVAVGGGKVMAQQLAITGMGSYPAPKLASERAEVTIDGNGEVRLAASTTLAVRIGGVGHVRYQRRPGGDALHPRHRVDRERLNRTGGARNPWASTNPTPKEPEMTRYFSTLALALAAALMTPQVKAEKVVVYREGQLVNPQDVATVLGKTRSIRLLDDAPARPDEGRRGGGGSRGEDLGASLGPVPDGA